jgi:hypothetical protein
VERNPQTGEYQLGALISARWLTEEAAIPASIALRTSLRRHGWMPSTVVWLQAPGCSSQLLLTVAPYQSPYTKGKSEVAAMRQPLKNLRKCLLQYETEADHTLLDLYYEKALIVAVRTS